MEAELLASAQAGPSMGNLDLVYGAAGAERPLIVDSKGDTFGNYSDLSDLDFDSDATNPHANRTPNPSHPDRSAHMEQEEHKGCEDDEDSESDNDMENTWLETFHELERPTAAASNNEDNQYSDDSPDLDKQPEDNHRNTEAPLHHRPSVVQYGPHVGKNIAGKVFPATTPPMPEYIRYRQQLKDEKNPYAPFKNKMDWEIARWAKLRGPGSTAFSELLSINGVR
ncbi:hypothetical protein BDZ94DRAFT_1316632 [Collybia nuda]|uniref:Uncharacterized protein n=1 Tax=Collybia nuda TaxID=64659 RepID=A0A9P5XQK0_9AGAR|nr:hypothetical protein BDZ94DRAFT_1316632 [Collybia nuda]